LPLAQPESPTAERQREVLAWWKEKKGGIEEIPDNQPGNDSVE
jgi:hypothetical protein